MAGRLPSEPYIKKMQKKEKEKPQDQLISKALLAVRFDDKRNQA